MDLIVRIPDEHAARVSGADPERPKRAALDAVLRASEAGGRDQRAMAGIASDLSLQDAAARIRAARPGNRCLKASAYVI